MRCIRWGNTTEGCTHPLVYIVPHGPICVWISPQGVADSAMEGFYNPSLTCIDKTLPRPYLNSCLEDPAGHFKGLLETDSSDRRNPRSEPSLSITGLLI